MHREKHLPLVDLYRFMSEYRLVEIHDAQSVSKDPLMVQHTEIKETPDVPWYRNGIKIGVSVPVSTLQQVSGLQNVQNPILNSTGLRQLSAGYTHTTGENIGGFYNLADVGSVWLYKDPKVANKWAKHIDRSLAPSFTLIDSGQGNGSTIAVVSAEDLVKILAAHPQMKQLRRETANAFVDRETGSITGIERAIQAATAPSLGQQMLQRGSRSALANGVSREEESVSVNSEGDQVAERFVERGVLLPGGQGVHIQQAVQQVVTVDSELGKRKLKDDLDRVEIRLRNLECTKLEIEQEQMKTQFVIDNEQKKNDNEQKKNDNKISTVNNFAKTMEMLNPNWRDDKRLVLQATDYLKNNIFNGSSAPQIENGAAESSESVSIGSVALELGFSISNAKAILAGKYAAKMYREKYKESPSKHHQTIGGNVILVNSYTLKDRDLLETAIQKYI